MNSHSAVGHNRRPRIHSRKTPLAACMAAAMAFSMSGPLMAHGKDSESAPITHRSLLLQSQTSGSAFTDRLGRRQADMADAAMQRFLGTQAPSVVTGATSIPVTNCNNDGAGSLRAAVSNANSGDTIDMSGLNCAVDLESSIVTARDDLTIQGNPDAKYPFINGQNTVRPLIHLGTGTLTLSGVTVEFGKFTSASDSKYGRGGCIYSTGDVVLTGSAQVKYCTAEHTGDKPAEGGAIFSAGSTTVGSASLVNLGRAKSAGGIARGGRIFAQDGVLVGFGAVINSSAVTNTGTFARGGGIYSKNGLLAKYSTIDGNSVGGGSPGLNVGGGAWVTGDTTIFKSTISGNEADSASAMLLGRSGGATTTGIYASTIANNTASESIAKYGGAVYLGNASIINNSTITGNIERNENDTKYGTGILIKKNASLEMSSSIVSGNIFIDTSDIEFPSDITGNSTTPATITGDHNLIGVLKFATAPADTINSSAPKLGPLQDNGGLTLTTAVLKNSPAINKGTANGYATDQRGPGFKRSFMFSVDIGAYERGGDTIFANGFEFLVL